jgi:hypothetical protein
MAKGKYNTPEFKEQAVTMVVGLDCTDWTPILTGRGQHGPAADRHQV